MYTREQMLTAMKNPKILEHRPEEIPEVPISADGTRELYDADRNVVDGICVDEHNRMKFNYTRR